ncbi:MAG: hypothetical protein H7834_05535 [Magnetococcus sp. YQC-9]
MTAAASHDLLLRAPNNKLHRVSAGQEFVVVQASSVDQVCGQWLVYSDSPRTRFAGAFRTSRMESVTGALLFNVEMSDTGEEFAVLLRDSGVTVLCIQLSPPKCPIYIYHQYLNSYCRLLGIPDPGLCSVAGGEIDLGRVPRPEEFAFRFINRAVTLVRHSGFVKADVSRHERGWGGESGIDALNTLRAWKANPDWYEPTSVASAGTLNLESHVVRPLRAIRRESQGTNMYTGAASTALFSLASTVSRGPVGGMAGVLLAGAARRLRTMDIPTQMTISEAWSYLESGTHPPRSLALSRLALEFRDSVKRMTLHGPMPGGTIPFLLAPPELVFQEFVIAKCLLALGLPLDRLSEAMRHSHTAEGCRFGDLIAWVDTSEHILRGWRDGTAKPADYQPDLVIVDTKKRRTILLDAKFRRDASGLLPASGVKDMQAYMHEFELPKAIIAVPATEGDTISEDVSARGFTIKGIALSPDVHSQDFALLAEQIEMMWNDNLALKGQQFQ